MNKIQTLLNKFKSLKESDKGSLLIHEQGQNFYRFTDKFNGIQIIIDYISKDSLSCQFLQIKTISGGLKNISGDEEKLHQLADGLCDKISYLSENFKMIELDRLNKQIQIRSYPPYQKENKKLYFEIIVKLDEQSITLQRLESNVKTNQTSKTAFVITDETLERLLTDLVV